MNKNAVDFKDLRIAYIGGGSRGWAWSLMGDLAMEPALCGQVRLFDIDYESAEKNAHIGNSLIGRSDVLSKWSYTAVNSLEEALKGVDLIVISILPGTFAEMDADVHMPEQFGLYQSVGDTVGPAGLMRALRTIPIFFDISKSIAQYAPKAWVINYTNPMTLATRALNEGFSDIKAIGCCHEVLGTKKLLAEMIMKEWGYETVPYKKINANVIGINHLTWFTQADYEGMNLFPLFKKFVDRYFESGLQILEEDADPIFGSKHRVEFDLFKKFGIIAASGDRHLAEFFPASWYLQSPKIVKEWGFSLTPVAWRKENSKKLIEKRERLIAGEELMNLNSSGEDAIDIIKALVGLETLVTNANIPNKGQVHGIPLGSVVETNVLITSDSVQPVFAGALPLPVEGIVARHVNNQETILQAALTKDKELAFSAFLNDPLVSCLKTDQAYELFFTMLSRTKNYLTGWLI